MPVGLILAAGAGRRFGATKQLAELHGVPLLQHAVEAMLAVPALERVIVVLGHAAPQIRAAVDFRHAEVVVAEDWDEGQAASLRCGLAAAAGADAVVITLGDQPYLSPEVIGGALGQLEGHDAVRAVYDGVPGHPVVLGPTVLAAAGELRGDQGARELLGRFQVHRWEAGRLADPVDVDTPEALRALR